MPDVDLGALTIPVFGTIFAAGWGACYLWVAKPLKERVDKLEAKQAELFSKFQDMALKDR